MRYLFGPVPSRRLGYSLGVDIIPHKACTLDCVYCQLGPTGQKTIDRKPYVMPAPVLTELDAVLASGVTIDCITFSGSGEPTLNSCLGDIITGIKKRCDIPICVLTNSTLLHLPAVRADLRQADIVCPSFDAATPESFSRMNRPHGSISLEMVTDGLVLFRREFEGLLFVEVMLAKGVNDSLEELEALARVLPRFGADKIQINTVTRPAAEAGVSAVDAAALELARVLFGPEAEIIGGFLKERSLHELENVGDRIVKLVARHPCSADDISAAIGLSRASATESIALLVRQGRIFSEIHDGVTFYKA